MSRSMPWCKLYSEVNGDPDITMLPLEQQAVYFRLLAHANEQTERGSFDISNRKKLARRVASGREDVLNALLDYLSTDWRCLEIVGDTATFKNWARFQRKPSDDPERTRERQKASREYHTPVTPSESSVTPLSRPDHAPHKREEVRGKSKDDVANPGNRKSSTSSSSSDNPMFIGAHVHDDDPDGQTFRQISATIQVLGSHLQEKALMALLDVARKRGFSNEALIFEAEQWASKLGDKRETPGAKVSSYREWMDTAFERGPPGNGKSLQDRVHKSSAEDRKILNDRYQKQFGRPAYPEDA